MYTFQPCTGLQYHFIQSHIGRVHVCLAVTCLLHFWQNGRDLLRATAVTRGWNGYRNKSQHRKLTLEGGEKNKKQNKTTTTTTTTTTTKIPPLLLGLHLSITSPTPLYSHTTLHNERKGQHSSQKLVSCCLPTV